MAVSRGFLTLFVYVFFLLLLLLIRCLKCVCFFFNAEFSHLNCLLTSFSAYTHGANAKWIEGFYKFYMVLCTMQQVLVVVETHTLVAL